MYRLKREAQLAKDNYTCQECGSKSNLEVHHIKYRIHDKQHKHLITLCYHCHSLKHPKARKRYLQKIGFFKDKRIKQSIAAKIANFNKEIKEYGKGIVYPCHKYIDKSLIKK